MPHLPRSPLPSASILSETPEDTAPPSEIAGIAGIARLRAKVAEAKAHLQHAMATYRLVESLHEQAKARGDTFLARRIAQELAKMERAAHATFERINAAILSIPEPFQSAIQADWIAQRDRARFTLRGAPSPSTPPNDPPPDDSKGA